MFKNNKGLIILFLFSLAIATVVITNNISKPYSLDEAQIALNSHHVADRGFSAFGERIAPGSRITKLQIPHPALHFGAIALSFRIFGEKNATESINYLQNYGINNVNIEFENSLKNIRMMRTDIREVFYDDLERIAIHASGTEEAKKRILNIICDRLLITKKINLNKKENKNHFEIKSLKINK